MTDTLPSPYLESQPQSDTLAVARQPVLDAQGHIVGYELFDRSVVAGEHSAASDAALLFNLLSNANVDVLAHHKLLFLNCTHQSLASGHLDLVDAQNVVLEIPPWPSTSSSEIEAFAATLAEVHRRGFRLAFTVSVFDAAYASWLPLASYIKLNGSQTDAQSLSAAVQRCNQHSAVRVIAHKIETRAQYDYARSLGVGLFQGYWFAHPELVAGRAIAPAQANIITLLNLVRKQASTLEIEEVFKRDPTLSFKLLRFINSAAYGLPSPVTSFRHAVMLLGLKKLFRWAALLLATAPASHVAPAIGILAVVRGRLMELLAAELLPPEDCDNAFLVGIFSLLDAMLGIPLEEALAPLALPDAVVQPLLHGSGVLAPILALTRACESADEALFARASDALGLSNQQVNWAHLLALNWAEQLGQ